MDRRTSLRTPGDGIARTATRAGQSAAVAALALCAFVFAPRAIAWTPFGPTGGSVRALVHDAAGVLYAGTYAGGVFRSGDGGATWASVAPQIRDQTVNALALDPSAPGTVFAGTYSSGVWRTSDGGATWTRVLFGGRDTKDRHASISAIAIDPTNAKVVYAATDTGFNAGVWRSADGGGTWTQSTAGLPPNFRLNALAIHPATPAIVYVGTNSHGVFRSADAGRTWSPAGETPGREMVLSLAVDPVAPDTVFVGTIATASSGRRTAGRAGRRWAPGRCGTPACSRWRSTAPIPRSSGRAAPTR